MSMTMHFDNESDYEYDVEAEEKFIQQLRAVYKSERTPTYFLNAERVKEFSRVYTIAKEYFYGVADVSYKQGSGISIKSWDIFIRAKELKLSHMRFFVNEVLRHATCFEVTAEPDGSVLMAITFYGMVDAVKEKNNR